MIFLLRNGPFSKEIDKDQRGKSGKPEGGHDIISQQSTVAVAAAAAVG
jgi:hypothetical protein